MEEYRSRANQSLERWLPSGEIQPVRLHKAMRYVVLNGGKRVRPILVYMAGRAAGAPLSALDGPACAMELIHAYSLVHDDLPAMDDDDLRRGEPTCHRAFDEATAVLVGDALQSLAFYVLSHDPDMQANSQQRLQMIESLALASGSRGMAGGQALDLAAVGNRLDLAELENMHIHKTGALIRASVRLGALSRPDVDAGLLGHLDRYAKYVGLAFQIRDDVLDVEGETDTIGKQRGADIAKNKPTYPSLIGVSESKRMAAELHEQALECLEQVDGGADPLRWLSAYIVQRLH
ncbi:MAG: (2E,6E)-farnesyl diphosphate synthase [Gammaproteobacteria bacterium]|nr:MAG: (2E,6E)-farnesyl diphosphate synthase [Gammaproteobacteria bacterium]